MSRCRWNLLPPVPDQQTLGIADFSPLLVQLLYNRGISRPEEFQTFLVSDKSLSDDPFRLPPLHVHEYA